MGDAANIDALSDEFRIHDAGTLSRLDLRDRFDVIVVNLGDYDLFHGGALPFYDQTHVVTIFHDSDIRHLMMVRTPSGMPLAKAADFVPRELRCSEGGVERAAHLALFAGLSAGAVAHGLHYLGELQAACPGPVAMLPLCYPDLGSVAPVVGDGPFVVTTFGMINPNKQPMRIMRAMAASIRLRERGVYRLVGPVEEEQRNRLTQFAAELGLQPPEFHGWVPDERLFKLLAQSHAICCLRYPVSEGGSASLITALYTARPVIVADVASYSLVPDDAVWKVGYGETIEDLSAALESIEADRQSADTRARLAREWAKHQYSAEAYVEALVPFLGAAAERVPALDAGRQIGRELAQMGMSLDDPAALRIGMMIETLFDSGIGQRA